MIIKRTNPRNMTLNTSSLIGFNSITKSGKPRKLDQDFNRLGRLNTGLQLTREIRKIGTGIMNNIGGDN